MTSGSLKSLVFGGVALSALVSAAPASAAVVRGFALSNDGATLVRFDPGNLGNAISLTLGGDGVRLDAIDFRPATGNLIGYDSRLEAFYRVNPVTGQLTRIDDGLATGTTAGNQVDIDWNPTIDRMRAVSSGDDNIVFNPATGGTTQAVDLFYGALDVNAGSNPNVVGNAYTNSFAGNFGGTTIQYVLDSRTNVLSTLANNAGTLTTVAGLTFNGAPFILTETSGFDIFFDASTATNIAYVQARNAGLSDLFTLDLATGVLSSAAGAFAANLGRLNSLAVGAVNEIPIPAAAPLFLGGLAGAAALSRKRRRKTAPAV
ncbi:MAG: DUF4394 domain-containing protein [Parvularculaceae bacterium]